MDRRPVWLRGERSYRAYVRGLRYSLLAMLLVGLDALGTATVAVPAPVRDGLVILAFLVAIPSIVIGAVGWVMVPDKKRASLHQGAFLAMVAHDIFRGLPSG